MSYVFQDSALRILSALHEAEEDVVGAEVEIVTGETGTVREIKLDEHHGLCFTVDPAQPEHRVRFYPVSFVRAKS